MEASENSWVAGTVTGIARQSKPQYLPLRDCSISLHIARIQTLHEVAEFHPAML